VITINEQCLLVRPPTGWTRQTWGRRWNTYCAFGCIDFANSPQFILPWSLHNQFSWVVIRFYLWMYIRRLVWRRRYLIEVDRLAREDESRCHYNVCSHPVEKYAENVHL